MHRLLSLWLTLLGAFWLARAAVSALLFERAADTAPGAFALLVAVPLVQAALLGWLTREPPQPPPEEPSFDPAEGVVTSQAGSPSENGP